MSELLPPTSGTQVEVGTVEFGGAVYFPSPLTDDAGEVINPATSDDIASVVTALSGLATSSDIQALVDAGEASYTLAAAENITSGASTTAVTGLQGGSYIWNIVAGNYASATIKLQALASDGTTWLDVATSTANENEGVVIGHNASVRLTASGGSPTGVSSSLT